MLFAILRSYSSNEKARLVFYKAVNILHIFLTHEIYFIFYIFFCNMFIIFTYIIFAYYIYYTNFLFKLEIRYVLERKKRRERSRSRSRLSGSLHASFIHGGPCHHFCCHTYRLSLSFSLLEILSKLPLFTGMQPLARH